MTTEEALREELQKFLNFSLKPVEQTEEINVILDMAKRDAKYILDRPAPLNFPKSTSDSIIEQLKDIQHHGNRGTTYAGRSPTNGLQKLRKEFRDATILALVDERGLSVFEVLGDPADLLVQTTQALTEAKEAQALGRQVAEEIRVHLKDTVVTAQARHFDAARESCKKLSWLSFWLIVVLAAAAIGVAFCMTRVPDQYLGKKFTVIDYLLLTTPRLLIFTVLATGIVLAARSLMASLHNMTVNSHRMNLLNAIKAFDLGVGDHALKEQIVVEACRTVMLHQPTGFNKEENSPGVNLSQLIPGVGTKTE